MRARGRNRDETVHCAPRRSTVAPSLTVIWRTGDNMFAGKTNIFRHARDSVNYITDTTISGNYRNAWFLEFHRGFTIRVLSLP